MASRSRVFRGRQTQELAAKYMREHGFPETTSRAASLPGIDLINPYGLAPEVKATPGDITGALKQAVKNANDGLPFVIWRPNGYGPERIDDWPVIFRFKDALWVLEDGQW